MAQGFKKNTAKKKEKMVLAKDKNQLILAIIVMCVFFGNTIFMAVKNFNEQQMYSNPQQAASSGFPIWIIVLVVVILLVILGAVGFVLKSKGLDNLIDSSQKVAAESKKPGKAGKMALAKDKNQLILAVVVMVAFFGNTVFQIVKYFKNQAPPPTVSSQQAKDLAIEQRKNLENMNNPNGMPLENSGELPGSPEGMNSQMSPSMNSPYQEQMAEQNMPQTPQTAQLPGGTPDDAVDVLSRKKIIKGNQKMVMISVDNTGRQNPFLPANEINIGSGISSLPILTPPPETLPIQSDAGKVMTTTISGILYDKYNPSAIINIEGTDYLVKKGDVINSYRILAIGKTEVIVQLGKNIYKAGVGELLTQTSMNYNTIANLNKKFGGNEVSINVKKKGY